MDSPLNKEGGLGGLVKAEATTTVDIHKVAYDNFINSIKSDVTKERYVYCLNRYLKYLGYSDDRIDILLLSQQTPKVSK
jgi:hypothetical protein